MSKRAGWAGVFKDCGKAALLALVVALVAYFIAGCTTISHRAPVDDFPRLSIIENHVHGGIVLSTCYKYVSWQWRLLGAIPEGCAEVNFAENTCTIWVRSDYPDKRVLEHERLHCLGYDHPGDNAIRGAWAAWKSNKTTYAEYWK